MVVVVVVVVGLLAFLAGGLLARRTVHGHMATVARGLSSETATAGSSVEQTVGQLERTVRRAREGELAARDQLARARLALDSLPLGIVIAGSDGEVELRNAAASSFLGSRTGDALVEEAVRGALRAALAGDGFERRSLEVYGPPRRSIELTAMRFDTGAVVEIEDVTERARLEAVRTDFVANISHELRTPVGAIALLAETIVDEEDTEVTRRLSEKMVLEAHRAARIIEDLLELSRIEAGEQAVREPVAVEHVFAEAEERVAPVAEARDIRVVLSEPPARLSVLGDRRQLVSALANLLENGVKYSDAGSSVEVTARAEGRWIDLVVVDHGIGIPARDLDRVFERFYRVDRARSRETGGTGLGLAIVRHVAHNHGGSVSVSSQEGVGSTFTLRLPAAPAGAVSPGAASPEAGPS